MMPTDPPSGDVLEICILSRGYGESIIIKLPERGWFIIDSHLDDSGSPAALSYLNSVGCNTEEDVQAILLTHWHDDHVAGAAKLIAACPNAVIALSGFLQRDEFAQFLESRGAPEAGSFGTGIDELEAVLEVIAKTKQPRKWCWAEKNIAVGRDGGTFRFEALSPSERDFEEFITAIAQMAVKGTRLSPPPRNDSSVASVFELPSELLLFGADLENGPKGSGWIAVHNAVWQARGKATFFKVAHHGSKGADYEPVWVEMLIESVMCALTPWNRGRKLPKQRDVDRILGRTKMAYAAAKPKAAKKPKRLNAVERSLREANIKLTSEDSAQGLVRMRKVAGGDWKVELFGAACHLSDVLAA